MRVLMVADVFWWRLSNTILNSPYSTPIGGVVVVVKGLGACSVLRLLAVLRADALFYFLLLEGRWGVAWRHDLSRQPLESYL